MVSFEEIIYNFPTFALKVNLDANNVYHAEFIPPTINAVSPSISLSTLAIEVIRQLDEYCNNPRFKFDLPFSYDGTPHQLKVWQIMQQIEAGSTLTYGEVARQLVSAPRAVGGACGANPLPVFIPCHRIIAANSKLGGFNSGNIFFNLGIKKWLLNHEGIAL
ncbi:MAG: methylated-DNA--[protein]-cysteine S-methyltransferase [Burkholderiales bacterium]|nr:methylated-DNA--[protein]-cysteine S-methyltransferase [Burkholderiales bacterium]